MSLPGVVLVGIVFLAVASAIWVTLERDVCLCSD